MARDYIDVGSAPVEEECAMVGAADYHEKARPECIRYIDLLRQIFGPEPAQAQLSIRSNPHDFGSYLSVVCYYETTNEAAAEYAYRCEDNPPRTWVVPVPDGDQPVAVARACTVCSSCLGAADEEGVPDRETQETLMIEMGSDLPDHLCDAREAPEVGLECRCACQRN